MRKLIVILSGLLLIVLASYKPIDGLLYANFISQQGGIPTDSLVAYYPFNGNANDESGNGNNGTVNGATLTTDRDGNSNNAYSFDGINDEITIGSVSSFPFIQNTGIFTISYWMQFVDYTSTPQYMMGSTSTAAEKGFYNGVENDKLLTYNITRGGGSVIYSKTAIQVITDNDWHHVVVTGNGTNITYYIDNSSYAGSNSMGTFSTGNSTRVTSLGRITNFALYFFEGKLDDIRIYNRTLTTDEITALYNE